MDGYMDPGHATVLFRGQDGRQEGGAITITFSAIPPVTEIQWPLRREMFGIQ